MADPIGAPTFAQMFSPAKSPFHAISLAALGCLLVTQRAELAEFGPGLALTILCCSSLLAPAFRPRYTNRAYGLSLMYARSAGLIGALICVGVLVKGSSLNGGASQLAANSDMFRLLWFTIVFYAVCMGSLFFFRTREITDDVSQFNIIQFCLMHTILLIFIVIFACGQNDYGDAPARHIIGSGGYALLRAPIQIFDHRKIPTDAIVYALMLLWCGSGIINGLLLSEAIERGWVIDHGEGDAEIDYSKS